MLRTAITWIIGIAIVAWFVQNPATAASWVKSAIDAVQTFIAGL